MRIATWNVNSIRQRMDNLQAWLKEREPDIVCLQEIKCVDDAFPREAFEALGYNVAVHGQKDLQRRGFAVQAALRRGDARPRSATTATCRPASWKRWSRTKTGVLRVVEPLSAQWQPAGDRKIYLQTQMDGPAYCLFT